MEMAKRQEKLRLNVPYLNADKWTFQVILILLEFQSFFQLKLPCSYTKGDSFYKMDRLFLRFYSFFFLEPSKVQKSRL